MISPNIIFESSDISFGNMSFKRGSPKEALKNRKRFIKKNNLSFKNLIELNPVHGNEVVVVENQDILSFKADGIVSNLFDTSLMILTADCIPIGIFDPFSKSFGLVHGGRVSLEKGILKNTIKSMQKKFNINPENLKVKFGPSIGPCCYKWDNIKTLNPTWKNYFNKGFLDIRSYAFDQLVSLGVNPKNIKVSKICTFHSGKFFSHRKSVIEQLPNNFRFGTIMGLKNYAN